MFPCNMKTVLKMVLALGVAGIVTNLPIPQVRAEKPSVRAGKDGPRKPAGKPATPNAKPGSAANEDEVSGMVQSLEGTKITLLSKQKTAQTLDLAPDAKVYLDDGSEGKNKLNFTEGKLSDITRGTSVTFRLSNDRKTVVRVWVEAPTVQGSVRAVNDTARTITVALAVGKAKTAEEKTLRVADDALVVLHDARQLDKQQPARHQLTDVPAGAVVTLRLSASRKLVTSIQAEGPTIQGTVKAVDSDKNTITLELQLGATKVDQTYTVPPTASVAIGESKKDGGKLADIPVGALATLKLAPDQKAVVSLFAQGPTIAGTVKAVDAEKNRLTLHVLVHKGEPAQEKTYDVAKDAALRIDGKPGTLPALPKEAVARIRLSLDQKHVIGLEAEGTGTFGIVKGVDAANNRITLANKSGELTLTVAKEAHVSIDGKEAPLEKVPLEAVAAVRLTADQSAALAVAAGGPHIRGVLKGVDPARKTITVAVPVSKNETEDRTFAVAADAQVATAINGVPLALTDLKADKMVVLELSADQKSARRVLMTGE
jgi:hypothetical protein